MLLYKKLIFCDIFPVTSERRKGPNAVLGLGIPNEGLHFLSVIRGCKKLCAYCLSNKIRTKAGWFIYTKFKCDYCNVPLCQERSGRFCHLLYHKHLAENFSGQPEEAEALEPLPDRSPFMVRRKHPRKGKFPPMQFMHISDNERIDLDSGNEDDDLQGPFFYDETGIQTDTKPINPSFAQLNDVWVTLTRPLRTSQNLPNPATRFEWRRLQNQVICT